MNILFLTLTKLTSLKDTMVYTDMLHTFEKHGHFVYAICPLEKKDNKESYIEQEGNIFLLHANIGGNYFNVGTIEKGFTLLRLEKGYIKGISEKYADVRFDLVLYTTPPITFNNVVEFVKKRDNAMSYLMLKDIFPQNAVDMEMMSKHGLKGILYKYFRMKEKKLYQVSDYIGCMSPANEEYVKKNNPEVDKTKVELSPNSIIVRDMSVGQEKRNELRLKYEIPLDKKVFVYGGNLGKPQGIDFLVECLRKAHDEEALFLIIGDGSDQYKIQEFVDNEKPENVMLMKRLPKEDYDLLVSSCDVGLIFLDHRFTIPNFPSRLLSYMQSKIPTLAVTDKATDVGAVIEDGVFGWWCESNDSNMFVIKVREALDSNLTQLGENGFDYLKSHYDVEDSVNRILAHIQGCKR